MQFVERVQRYLVLVTVLGGCDDGRCIEGACPDYAETRKLPGPCRGGSTTQGKLEFTYDDDQRLTRAGSMHPVTHDDPQERFLGSEWTYDATGALQQLLVLTTNDGPRRKATWTFDGAEARIQNGTTYDRAELEFLPLIGFEVAEPVAELGMTMFRGLPVEWTVEATPGGTTRTRHILSADETEVTSTSVFQLDERGRIVVSSHDYDTDGTPDAFDRFVYEGDLLVHQERSRQQILFSLLPRIIDWTYDAGGNVVEGTTEDGYREVFSYDCW